MTASTKSPVTETCTCPGTTWLEVGSEYAGHSAGDTDDFKFLNFDSLPAWTSVGDYHVLIEWGDMSMATLGIHSDTPKSKP